MNTRLARSLTVVGLLALVTTAAASADESALNMRARLSGLNESPPKATTGVGMFTAKAEKGVIHYTLTYSGLSTSALQAHLHFGQPAVNGGVFVFLCSNLDNGPAGTPACPAAGGTVTGTITAASILTIAPDQGLSAGDLATALRIIEAGDAYANVHTSRFPAGEIRGQVSAGGSSSD
ncbi:MAG TPA: CHRD domain-containing protein [Candidatus Dormibacteraeota bacterium]|nr:CHRD domain-containing protein [Candidatus Dormibacteraeota bacterium]